MHEACGGSIERIGVIGGTFDPIHVAHLIIAEEARHRCTLDRVIFVPTNVSPLKQHEGTRFDNEQRYEMVAQAIKENPAFGASRIDIDREPPSYTVDTLRLLRQAYGDEKTYFFIMGADSLAQLPHWYQPDQVLRLARLIVVSRPGHDPDLSALEAKVEGVAERTEILRDLEIGISSTEIRQRLAQNLPIRYWVPEQVYACISTYSEGVPDRLVHTDDHPCG